MQNLFDKASLVMVPSGYDNGKLYNIKPEDKGSAFEFERATMATRVNSSGLVETMFPEATNLLLQSNNFDTTWTGELRTPGFEGYDGSNDGWKVTKSAQSYTSIQQTASLSGVWTLSVYAKSDTLNDITFRNQTDGTRCDFDLLNGVVGFSGSAVIAKNIQDIGNGWYRCQATFTGSSSQIAIYVAWNNATAGSVFIQDAQLEAGYFATPYIETTTQTVTRQNQANQPRIDYTSGEGALLLEPARTNLYANSGDFTTWNRYNNIPYEVSNENVISGEKSVIFDWQDTNTFIRLLGQTFTGIHTTSMYIKPLTLTRLQFNYTVIDKGATFDFNSNSIVSNTGTAASIEDVGDGWYRLISTADLTGTSNSQLRVSIPDNIYAGTAHVSGFQQEAGSYPTSYIPTNGQQETRADEVLPFPSVYEFGTLGNGESGTLFIETIVKGRHYQGGVYPFYLLSQGGSGVWSWIGNNFYIRTTGTGNGNNINLGENPIVGNTARFGLRKDGSSFSVFFNGELKGTEDVGTSSLQWATHLATYESSQAVKVVAEFPETLTDEELQRLTSPSADATTFTELANNNGYTIL